MLKRDSKSGKGRVRVLDMTMRKDNGDEVTIEANVDPVASVLPFVVMFATTVIKAMARNK